MSDENYQKVLERISRVSGVSVEDLERRVEAKRAKLSGLISKEGAAQIVASELGVSFDNEKLKIDELLPGMRNVSVIGKVIQLFPVRTYVREGIENKVANLIIADETSNIRVVIWDTKHIAKIEDGTIKEGSIVEISRGSMRGSEIHLGSFSELKLSDEVITEVRLEPSYRERKISDISEGEKVSVRAFIVQVFPIRFFEVCPECGKRVNEIGECPEHGKVSPEKRALLNLVIDDGTGTLRTVIFNDLLNSLGLDISNEEEASIKKDSLLGKEFFFSGTIRRNRLFNNLEFIIDKVEEVDVSKLLELLEH